MNPNPRDLPARAAQRADAFRHLPARAAQRADAFRQLRAGLTLPLIAAPMFLVSGTALVGAASRAGIVGAFPTANCRTSEHLDQWLRTIGDDARRHEDATGRAAAPRARNLSVHRSNCFATAESLVPPAHQAMLVAASADDIVLTRAFTGLPTSLLRPSIVAAGLDPDAMPERGAIDIAQDISVEA